MGKILKKLQQTKNKIQLIFSANNLFRMQLQLCNSTAMHRLGQLVLHVLFDKLKNTSMNYYLRVMFYRVFGWCGYNPNAPIPAPNPGHHQQGWRFGMKTAF